MDMIGSTDEARPQFVMTPTVSRAIARTVDIAEAVLTESGGLQKEEFFEGKPCVTVRNGTEWVDQQIIEANVLFCPSRELESEDLFQSIQEIKSEIQKISTAPYGDGVAAEKVLVALAQSRS